MEVARATRPSSSGVRRADDDVVMDKTRNKTGILDVCRELQWTKGMDLRGLAA